MCDQAFYGPIAQMTFGYGAVARFETDRNYRITGIKVGNGSTPDTVIDRTYSWTGDVVNSIVDNKNPGVTPGQYGSQSQSFTYYPTRRLRTASGYYGSLSWLYDANGNRIRETANGVASNYAYPATSNRLIRVTPAGGTARSFTYDAAGDIVRDTRVGALGMTFEYDVEGRLSKAFQTNAPTNVSTYGYDAQNRLASRAPCRTAPEPRRSSISTVFSRMRLSQNRFALFIFGRMRRTTSRNPGNTNANENNRSYGNWCDVIWYSRSDTFHILDVPRQRVQL